MQFSSWTFYSWLLATLPPQVLSVQIQDVITGSGGVNKVAKKTHAIPTKSGLDIDFGGSYHGVVEDEESAKTGDLMRPEVVKMQVCQELPSQCNECTTQASCWRGARKGVLSLAVPATARAKYYAAEMWASCAGGNGEWTVVVFAEKLVNGFIKIFVDGSLHHTVDASHSTNKHGKSVIDIAIAKNTRVRILFERSTAGQAASAQVRLRARGVDEYVDECMGVKNCLVSVGDGSPSAFRFRNSNVKQLACLVATTAQKRAKVSDHCEVWETCVSSSGISSKLKALLGAALTPRGSLAEGKLNMQKLNDAEGCVDPSVEDPESWECECMDAMTASCGGVDEECFNKILCDNTNVCESWKGAHCAGALLAKHKVSIQASQNKSAALMRRVSKMAIAIVDDRLDSALSGKCSQ